MERNEQRLGRFMRKWNGFGLGNGISDYVAWSSDRGNLFVIRSHMAGTGRFWETVRLVFRSHLEFSSTEHLAR